MGMTVDGMISGMNTTETIAQLMQVEALPQQALKSKVNVQTKVVSAYQSINTRLSSVLTAAQELGGVKSWGSMKATSSSDAAVVTAQPGATSGSLSFRVEQLAATHLMTYTGTSVADAGTDPVMSGSTFDITLKDGTTRAVTPDGNNLQAVVAAINKDTDALYKASAVQIGPGKFTLQLSAKQSGQSAAFADGSLPTGLDLGAATTTAQGTDARLKVGDTADAYEVTSPSNTFADVLSGVTVTAARKQVETDPLVTIDLTADAQGIAAKVKALVDTANVALSEIASQTKGKNGPVAGGPLAGDSAVRKIAQDILSTVSGGAGALGSFKDVGVSLADGGQLKFNEVDFLNAYTKDPVKTQSYFDSYTEKDSKTDTNPTGKGTEGKFEPGWDVATGLARKLETLAAIASEGVDRPDDRTAQKLGIVPGLMRRQNDNIRQLNDQVAAWDTRLELRRSGLERQFSNLEVALGKMKQQSSWLAGQLAGLA